MEIEIVKWFQSFGNNFLDGLNSVLTLFGEDIFFMCVFMFFYWCVSYYDAYKFSLFYCISVAINSVIKSIVKRPRPWMASSEIENKLPASGYSFPSGHSQSISAISTYSTYNVYKSGAKNGVKIGAVLISVVLCITVALTRLYLGQHYLTDVLTGLVLGTVVMLTLLLLSSKFDKLSEKVKPEYVLITISALLLLIMTLSTFIKLNLSVNKLYKLYKYTGLACGGTIGFIICNKSVPNIVTSVNQRLIKLAIGYVLVFGIATLFKLLPQTNIITFLTMLILSFIATCVYPLIYNIAYNKFVKKEN